MGRFDEMIQHLIEWDKTSNRFYAAVVVGSQARQTHRADENSDLDVMIFVDDPDFFISSDQWLHCVGDPRISFWEHTFAGGKERRVLFDGASDVDFMFLPKNAADKIAENNDLGSMFLRGYRVLIDKIGLELLLAQIPKAAQVYAFPSEPEFLNLINDFWFHTVWASKKILRGELWTAKYCVDTYLKSKLLCLIEHHAHAINGQNYDTWHNGRFLEEWADGRVVEKLSRCFAHYEKEDVKFALLATMDLFRPLAVEVAKKLGYEYPAAADEYAADWVKKSL